MEQQLKEADSRVLPTYGLIKYILHVLVHDPSGGLRSSKSFILTIRQIPVPVPNLPIHSTGFLRQAQDERKNGKTENLPTLFHIEPYFLGSIELASLLIVPPLVLLLVQTLPEAGSPDRQLTLKSQEPSDR
ncbi:MAG: hypothetical protein ACRERU_05315 [Methylococcales bacterium]